MQKNSKKVTYFENMQPMPDQNLILVRLGYRKNTTVLSEEHQAILKKGIQKGLALCRSKGALGRYAITQHQPEFVQLETGHKLESRQLSALLANSDEVILMASTVGEKVVQRISEEISSGDATLGAIMDAVASQTADKGLEWMLNYLATVTRREGKKITQRRYSPGYGDLALENQKMIFDLLQLDKVGLALTEKYMLVPEKSVIAIAGIEKGETLDEQTRV